MSQRRTPSAPQQAGKLAQGAREQVAQQAGACSLSFRVSRSERVGLSRATLEAAIPWGTSMRREGTRSPRPGRRLRSTPVRAPNGARCDGSLKPRQYTSQRVPPGARGSSRPVPGKHGGVAAVACAAERLACSFIGKTRHLRAAVDPWIHTAACQRPVRPQLRRPLPEPRKGIHDGSTDPHFCPSPSPPVPFCPIWLKATFSLFRGNPHDRRCF